MKRRDTTAEENRGSEPWQEDPDTSVGGSCGVVGDGGVKAGRQFRIGTMW